MFFERQDFYMDKHLKIRKGFDEICIYGTVPKVKQVKDDYSDDDLSESSVRSMNSDDIGIKKLSFLPMEFSSDSEDDIEIMKS